MRVAALTLGILGCFTVLTFVLFGVLLGAIGFGEGASVCVVGALFGAALVWRYPMLGGLFMIAAALGTAILADSIIFSGVPVILWLVGGTLGLMSARRFVDVAAPRF